MIQDRKQTVPDVSMIICLKHKQKKEKTDYE